MPAQNTLLLEIWDELKCVKCDMYLSVKPIGILEEGTHICGRCYSKYESLENRILIIHAKSLERFLSKLLMPCSNALQGCYRMLKLSSSQAHEDNCTYKIYKCPCIPWGSCGWTGNEEKLLEHFQVNHDDLTLLNGKFDLLLDRETATNKLLSALGRLFLVQMKISTCNNVLYGLVKLLGPSRHAQDYSYSFEFSDASNTSSFVNAIHTKEKHAGTDHTLMLDPNLAVQVDVNEILSMVGFSKKVSCTAMVQLGEQRRSATPDSPETLLCCKWPNCCQVYLAQDHQTHVDSCPLRTCTCKWEGCNQVCHGDEINHHTVICEHRIHPCRWDGCTDLMPYKNIEEHEEVCDKRLTTLFECDMINEDGPCDVHLPLKKFIDHIREKHTDCFFETAEVTRTESLWSGSHFFIAAYGELFRCALGQRRVNARSLAVSTDLNLRQFAMERRKNPEIFALKWKYFIPLMLQNL